MLFLDIMGFCSCELSLWSAHINQMERHRRESDPCWGRVEGTSAHRKGSFELKDLCLQRPVLARLAGILRVPALRRMPCPESFPLTALTQRIGKQRMASLGIMGLCSCGPSP